MIITAKIYSIFVLRIFVILLNTFTLLLTHFYQSNKLGCAIVILLWIFAMSPLVCNPLWWGWDSHCFHVLHGVCHAPVCRVLPAHTLHPDAGQAPACAPGRQAPWEDALPAAPGARHRVCVPGRRLPAWAAHVLRVQGVRKAPRA